MYLTVNGSLWPESRMLERCPSLFPHRLAYCGTAPPPPIFFTKKVLATPQSFMMLVGFFRWSWFLQVVAAIARLVFVSRYPQQLTLESLHILVHALTSSPRWRPPTSAHSVLSPTAVGHLLLILDKRIVAALLKFQMRSTPQSLLIRLCNLTRMYPIEC